jgi:hypothetical protein
VIDEEPSSPKRLTEHLQNGEHPNYIVKKDFTVVSDQPLVNICEDYSKRQQQLGGKENNDHHRVLMLSNNESKGVSSKQSCQDICKTEATQQKSISSASNIILDQHFLSENSVEEQAPQVQYQQKPIIGRSEQGKNIDPTVTNVVRNQSRASVGKTTSSRLNVNQGDI